MEHLELNDGELPAKACPRAVGKCEQVPIALHARRFLRRPAVASEPALGPEQLCVFTPDRSGTVDCRNGGGDESAPRDVQPFGRCAGGKRERRGESNDVVFIGLGRAAKDLS